MRTLLAAIAVALLAPAAGADDWPQWRGPKRDGVSAETGLLTAWPKGGPKLAWKANVGGVGYGSPVIVGDKLFAAAAEDNQDGQKEIAVCLSAADGKPVWKAELPVGDGGYSTTWGSGPRSTPTADGGFVYLLGGRGDLVCLKAADGSKVWAVNLKADFGGAIPGWGYSESVLIDGDRLVCTPGGKSGALLALDKKTGKKLWQSEELKDGAGYSSILAVEVGGVRQYVTQTQQAAVGVRAADGKLLWRVANLKRAVAVIPTPVVDGNLVFFTAGYGAGSELLKLSAGADGAVTAEAVYGPNKLMVNQHGGVVRLGDYAYGYSDNGGKWLCFEWKKNADEPVWDSKELDKGSVTAAGGHLYCYGQGKGTCVLVDASPDGWKEKGRLELPAKSEFPRGQGAIWAHPVVANGKLYLRDHELLFCFDVRGK